jgi:alkylation response protein AidB-like acyl-CoA dehydrogenase
MIEHESTTSITREALLARLPALAARLAEGAARRELERELPFEGAALFKQSGLGMLRIPASLGGPGGSVADVIEVVATLASADSNLAHALRIHFHTTELLAVSPYSANNEVQVKRVLAGAIFGGASTELGTARPGIFNTTLTRSDAGFRLNGTKYYATGTQYSDFANINALDEQGRNVIAIIPTDRRGVRVLDDWDGMGQRMTASGSLVLDDVEVGADEFHLREYDGLPGRHVSALRQLHLVTVGAGIVRNVLRDVVDYVQHRGRPAAHVQAESARTDPLTQQVVGEIAAQSHAIDALVAQNAQALDRSALAIERNAPDADALVIAGALATASTQVVVSRLALQAAERMFEAGGASATSRSLNLDRHWRNLRTIFSHNPLTHKARIVGDYHLNGVETHLREGKVF